MKNLTKNEISNVCGAQDANGCQLDDINCYIYEKGADTNSSSPVSQINIPSAKFTTMFENGIFLNMNTDEDNNYTIVCPIPVYPNEAV